MADDKKDNTQVPNEGLSTSSDYVQIYLIEIEMKKGIDLVAADFGGKSDPYVGVGAFGRFYTTKTIMKTLNPVWNEKTQFCFFSDPKLLTFEVFDWDKHTKDDALGNCQLNVSNLFNDNSKGFSGKLKLENIKKGEIEVEVHCRKLLPIELETKASNLYQELDNQKNKIIEQNDNIRTLSDNNNELTLSNEKLTQHLGNLIHEHDDLNANLTSLRLNIEKLNQSMQVHQQDKNNYDITLKSEKDELKKLKDEIIDMKKLINKHESDNEHLVQEIQNTKQAIEDKNKEIKENKKKQEEELRRKSNTPNNTTAGKNESEKEPIIPNSNSNSNNNNNNNNNNKGSSAAPTNTGCCIVL